MNLALALDTAANRGTGGILVAVAAARERQTRRWMLFRGDLMVATTDGVTRFYSRVIIAWIGYIGLGSCRLEIRRIADISQKFLLRLDVLPA